MSSPLTLLMGYGTLYLYLGRMTEYCNERVCLCVCLSVCLSVREHISGTICPIFTKFLCLFTMDVARSAFVGVAICYVLPVLYITS